MKQTELMLGDLVTFKDCLKGGRIIPIEIREIRTYNTDVLVCIDGDQSCDLIELNDEIVGIPITPEILEKNGWFYPPKSTWMKLSNPFRELWGSWHTDGTLWLYPSSDCDKHDDFAEIHYVHELQHCLKLVGISKEIIL